MPHSESPRTSTPAFRTQNKIVVAIRKRWKAIFFLLFGAQTLSQVLRGWIVGKFMDSLFAEMGSLGLWLLTYPFAILTLVLIGIIVWIARVVISEATSSYTSTILDPKGNPINVKNVPQKWTIGFTLSCLAIIVFLGYGIVTWYHATPQALLEKYPLGYVMFRFDYQNEVFPYENRQLLDDYNFDWNRIRIVKSMPNMIGVQIPNMHLADLPRGIFQDISFFFPKKVGMGPTVFGDDKISLVEETLAVNGNGIVFLLGFKPSPPKR
jgi:hypothetical protein